jgi:hypothetical protein
MKKQGENSVKKEWRMENFAEAETEADTISGAKIKDFLNKHNLRPGQFVVVPGRGINTIIYYHSRQLQR